MHRISVEVGAQAICRSGPALTSGSIADSAALRAAEVARRIQGRVRAA